MQLHLLALLSILSTPTFGAVIRSPQAMDTSATDVGDLPPANNTGPELRAFRPPAFKRITNAERLKRGLGPLPPTKRFSAARARRSGNPEPSTQSTDESGDFNGPSVIRLRNPRDGSDMGIIAFPGGDDGDLALFDPNSGRAQRFETGKMNPGAGDIIEIFPVDMDDDYFHGKSPLLAARPRLGQSNPNIAPGSPDFLHVGLAALDQGLLKIRLPANLLGKSPATGTSLDGLTSGVPATDGLINAILPGDLIGGAGDPVTALVDDLLGDDGIPAQSAIWQYDPQTRRLVAHYTRPDGSVVPTNFVSGGPCAHLVCLTADVDAFKNAYGGSAVDLHAIVTVL